MNIGQFDIYLRSPTSTSKDIEIAINFATRDGIILTLDNDLDHGQLNSMIDCSWISNYPEENERLWVGYQKMWPLRIVSIRIVENNRNKLNCPMKYNKDMIIEINEASHENANFLEFRRPYRSTFEKYIIL